MSVLAVAFSVSVVLMSCGGGEDRPKPSDADPSASAGEDINDLLRQPGKITHVRYTSYTPPWPTRIDAWIDWENNRVRSWNVQWTDSPTNPSICTSIQDGDSWHVCLPSLEKIGVADFPRAYALWPKIPLRVSDSEISVPGGVQAIFGGESGGDSATSRIEAAATTSTRSQGDTDVVVNSWKITTDLGLPCDEGLTTSASFDYTATTSGEPISEFIMVSCGTERFQYLGVVYHEIEFVDASELDADFFDVETVRTSLITGQLSSAAAQLGTMFWLGEQPGEWILAGVEHEGDSARVGYTRGQGDDEDAVVLNIRVPGFGRLCDGAEPIPDDAYGGSLCTRDYLGNGELEYSILWTQPGFDLWLEQESYPPDLSRDDMLALAASLDQWDQRASGSLLDGDDVRTLIADSLELVCPSKLREIREARSRASFEFDRESGEWTGEFGSFGDFAVPDAKPVAIPVDQREEVESTLSHNAAQFAECIVDEQPTPQEGDDEFAVEFIGEDDSGISIQVTGIDSETEAALSFCFLADGDCVLTDPEGALVEMRGAEVNAIRPQVVRIHIVLGSEELSRSGTWTLALDLGDGRTAETTFDIQ